MRRFGGSIAAGFDERQETCVPLAWGETCRIMAPCIEPGGCVSIGRKARPFGARHSVSDDWVAALPREKKQLFETVVRRWESGYAMMSVALDDALSLRARGELICARQQVSIAADLLGRLSAVLVSSCDVLADFGKHFSDLPLVEPLKTEFFRGNTGQSAASWNGILHHVLFGDRSRFFHKLKILSGTVEQLECEFNEAADDLSGGLSTHPGACWDSLDCLHYDFNTCLREAEVVLKSFLRALPGEQMTALASTLEAPPSAKRLRLRPRLSRVSA